MQGNGKRNEKNKTETKTKQQNKEIKITTKKKTTTSTTTAAAAAAINRGRVRKTYMNDELFQVGARNCFFPFVQHVQRGKVHPKCNIGLE